MHIIEMIVGSLANTLMRVKLLFAKLFLRSSWGVLITFVKELDKLLQTDI